MSEPKNNEKLKNQNDFRTIKARGESIAYNFLFFSTLNN